MVALRESFGKIYYSLKHNAGLAVKPVLYFTRSRSIVSPVVKEKILYVDVSCTHFGNDKGGVPRVVTKFCEYLKKSGVRHELVYTKAFKGFFLCRDDSLVHFSENDVFFCPDFSLETAYNRAYFRNMMKHGVKVYFFLHDLIPLHFPTFYDFSPLFKKYLDNMLLCTGIIVNSKSVLSEVRTYIEGRSGRKVNPKITLDYAYLGSDFSAGKSKRNLFSAHAPKEFLMVSSVEPRKKYDQALEAFNLLWEKGAEINLLIVGRPVSESLKICADLESHLELNKKLFWYRNGISDDELSQLYEKCDAVIFASLEEGYGLAVVEAASYGKPVILRDIPVFREIAGDSAYYFSGLEGKDISDVVEDFMEHKKNGDVKLPIVKSNSWEGFTSKILDVVWK